MNVPKSVEEVVNEIYTKLDKLYILLCMFTRNRESSKPANLESISSQFNKLFNDVCHAFDTLPYKWCNVDPFKYNGWFRKYESASHSFFLKFGNTTNLQNREARMVEYQVPEGLCTFIKEWFLCSGFFAVIGKGEIVKLDLTQLDELKELTYNAKESIYSLKRILRIKQSIISPSEVSSKSDSNVRMINSGSTLVCPKGTFTFSKKQADIVNLFYINYKNGNDFIYSQDVLNAVNRPSVKFTNTFRTKKDSFNKLFKRHPEQKGLWRLSPE